MVLLSDVIKLEYGKPLPKEDRKVNGKYPAYGANGIKTKTDSYYFDKPSIIIGRKGSAGELTLTEEKFWPLDVTYFVTYDDKKYDLKYIYNLLSTLNLPGLAKGVKPGINRNEVYSLKIKNPGSIEEQRCIVEKLDEAFAALDKAKQNTEKNLKNSQELFRSEAKSIFNDTGETSKVVLLDDVAQIISGQSPRGQFYNHEGEGLPLYQGKKDFGAMFTADPSVWTTDITKIAEPNDILISVRAPVGPVNFASQKMNIGRGLAAIRPWEGLDSKYLFRFLQSRESEIESLGGGSTFQSINRNHLKSLHIPYPDIEIQRRVAHKLEMLFDQTQKLQEFYRKKLVALEELRRSILKQALEGKL